METMKRMYVTMMFVLISVTMMYGQKGELSAPPSSKDAIPQFKWVTDTLMSLGKIEANKPITVIFEFINSGGMPLVISRVEPSCGCTATDYVKEPVGPNKKGHIKVIYNAATTGYFSKTITVFSNASDLRKVLTIKGEVVKP
jgi:hypothetical protein